MSGILYLVPAPLTEDGTAHIPAVTTHVFTHVPVIFTEERKSTIRYIKQVAPQRVLQEINFIDVNEHTSDEEFPSMIELLLQGNNAALVSEAGLPCVADPGAKLVALVHAKGIQVIPLSGPSSMFMALMASGLNGQQFTFHGYLPRKPEERDKKIKDLEKESIKTGYTQLFIEAPYRNAQLLDALLKVLQPDTLLCLACEINGTQEFIRTYPVKDWRKNKPDIQKKNCVFLFGRG